MIFSAFMQVKGHGGVIVSCHSPSLLWPAILLTFDCTTGNMWFVELLVLRCGDTESVACITCHPGILSIPISPHTRLQMISHSLIVASKHNNFSTLTEIDFYQSPLALGLSQAPRLTWIQSKEVTPYLARELTLRKIQSHPWSLVPRGNVWSEKRFRDSLTCSTWISYARHTLTAHETCHGRVCDRTDEQILIDCLKLHLELYRNVKGVYSKIYEYVVWSVSIILDWIGLKVGLEYIIIKIQRVSSIGGMPCD